MSGWFVRGLCGHPEGQQESHEVQKVEAKSPAKQQPHDLGGNHLENSFAEKNLRILCEE